MHVSRRSPRFLSLTRLHGYPVIGECGEATLRSTKTQTVAFEHYAHVMRGDVLSAAVTSAAYKPSGLGGRRCELVCVWTHYPSYVYSRFLERHVLPLVAFTKNITLIVWAPLLPMHFSFFTPLFGHLGLNGSSRRFKPLVFKRRFGFFTLMMLLRRGAALTDSRRMVSVSWPPPPGRTTPLRRPRDALGGMKSGAASPHSASPYPSLSDMSMRRRGSTRRKKRDDEDEDEEEESDSNEVGSDKVWLGWESVPFTGGAGSVRQRLGGKLITRVLVCCGRIFSSSAAADRSWFQAESPSCSRSVPAPRNRLKSKHRTHGQEPLGWTGALRRITRNKSPPLPVLLVLEAGRTCG